MGLQINLYIWRDLPGEILEQVAEWLVLGCYAERRAYNVTSLSRVCHDWRRRFLPFLCRHLEINRWENFEGASLVASLRLTTRVCCHTTSIALQNVQNLTLKTIRELTVLLPSLERLTVSETSWAQSRSHPSAGKVFAGSWAGFTRLSHLRIHDCILNDSTDILQLLTALPALTSVELSQVVCSQTSSTIPSANRNRLTSVEIQTVAPLSTARSPLQHGSAALNMTPYVQYLWMLPHPLRPLAKDAGLRYPGFSPVEGQLLTQLAHCFLLPHKNDMKLVQARYANHCKRFLHCAKAD